MRYVDEIRAEEFASGRQGLPQVSYVTDPVSSNLLERVRLQFQGSPWGKPGWLSHRRILYRDACRDPLQVVDWWGPEELVDAADAAGTHDVDMFDFIEDDIGHQLRPSRVIEWVELFEPAPRETALLELDSGAAAFSVTRRYLNVGGDPILLQHRWVRVGTVLRFDRNLLWERADARGWFPPGFPDSGAFGCCGGWR